jgi:hypothetical protein
MGTTITPQTLTVTVTEKITIDGVTRNGSSSTTIGSVGQILTGILSAPLKSATAHNAVIASFGTAGEAETAAKVLTAGVKYFRLTNKDNTNFVHIRIGSGATDDNAVFKLEAGKSLVLGSLGIDASDAAIDVESATFVNASQIDVCADTAACDVEFYIATS